MDLLLVWGRLDSVPPRGDVRGRRPTVRSRNRGPYVCVERWAFGLGASALEAGIRPSPLRVSPGFAPDSPDRLTILKPKAASGGRAAALAGSPIACGEIQTTGSVDGEAGESPARARHCDREKPAARRTRQPLARGSGRRDGKARKPGDLPPIPPSHPRGKGSKDAISLSPTCRCALRVSTRTSGHACHRGGDFVAN
jgi:hypothetical protein